MKQLIVGSIVLLLVTCGWGHRSLGEQVPTPRGELRIVDSSPYNFVTVVLNVFEHLWDFEEGGNSSHASPPAGAGSTTVPWTSPSARG